MKLVLALAASLAATAAFAQSTTVIQRDAPATTVIERREAPATTVIERRSTTETTGSVGCETTKQSRTDAVTGDTTTRERTNC